MDALIPHVTVTDRDAAADMLRAGAPLLRCLLSIHDCDDRPVPGFDHFAGLKLSLGFDDVTKEWMGYVPADTADVAKIVAFARAVNGPTLIHCAAGISRSTAAAMAIPAVRLPPSETNARAICDWIVAVRFCAHPNPHIVSLLDHTIGWGGMLAGACIERFKR